MARTSPLALCLLLVTTIGCHSAQFTRKSNGLVHPGDAGVTAVAPVGISGPAQASALLTEVTETLLMSLGATVVQADLTPILAEQLLVRGDGFDPQSLRRLGDLTGAETVFVSSWTLDGGKSVFAGRGIDVSSGEVSYALTSGSDQTETDSSDHPDQAARFFALLHGFDHMPDTAWGKQSSGSTSLQEGSRKTGRLSVGRDRVTPSTLGSVALGGIDGAQLNVEDQVANGLIHAGFRVLERTRLADVMSRRATEGTDAFSSDSVTELGRMLGSDVVLTGSLRQTTLPDWTSHLDGNRRTWSQGTTTIHFFHLRLVAVEDGRIIWSSVHYSNDAAGPQALIDSALAEVTSMGRSGNR